MHTPKGAYGLLFSSSCAKNLGIHAGEGYSVPEIAKATNIPAPTLYNRVDAHRGRKDGKLAI